MTVEQWLTFWAASLALAIVPGPSVTVIIGNSLRYGTRAGLMNVAGTQVGLGLWLVLAGLGLSALVDLFGPWLALLRYAGALWLVWLGVTLWRSGGVTATREGSVARSRRQRSFFVQGVLVILTNPKMLVVFGALIPPFLPATGDPTAATLVLSLTFAVIAATTEVLYALVAGQARDWMTRDRLRTIARISGACLGAGGLWLALRIS
ncbi:MAG: LysE family translocator [Cypionkella sp.]